LKEDKMALNIEIPEVKQTAGVEAAPKKKTAPSLDLTSAPTLDLDALLTRIKEAKPEAAVKGRAPSAAAAKIGEALMQLCEKAAAAGIPRLPFGGTVKAIAVALGVDATKKSQYFYTLSQSVLRALGDKITTQKDGRNVFVVCIEGYEPPVAE
jgi:hypothetical protein